MSKACIMPELKSRPNSVCVLPLYRVKTDINALPTRVSRALQHTQDHKGYIFTRTTQTKLSATYLRTTQTPFKTSLSERNYRVASASVLTPRGVSTGTHSLGMSTKDGTTSMSTLHSQTTDSGSISLVPGVFQRKKPKPRIFVRYRRLSSEERVLHWLYTSCTHPLKTLPLLWNALADVVTSLFLISLWIRPLINDWSMKTVNSTRAVRVTAVLRIRKTTMGTGTAPVTGRDNFRHRDNFIPTSTKRVTKRLHSSQGQHPWQLQVTHLSHSQSESEQIWLQNEFEDSWNWKNIAIQFRCCEPSMCTDAPLPSEKSGEQNPSPVFFLRGGGRLYTVYCEPLA